MTRNVANNALFVVTVEGALGVGGAGGRLEEGTPPYVHPNDRTMVPFPAGSPGYAVNLWGCVDCMCADCAQQRNLPTAVEWRKGVLSARALTAYDTEEEEMRFQRP